jgi:multidrug efflux system membrane fusion protein
MREKIRVLLIGLVALGMVSCGMKEQTEPERTKTVPKVKVETLAPSSVEEVYEAVGTVHSRTTSTLSSRITGQILEVHVREGDLVKPGQLLVEIDDREVAAQLRRAQAGLQEAQEMQQEVEGSIRAAESAKVAAEADQMLAAATFGRYKVLLERRSVSPQEFDEVQTRFRARTAEADRAHEMLQSLLAKKKQVRARIDQARAEVASAQLSVGYAKIRSPIRGIVTSKKAEVGILATPGFPVITVEDNVHYRLESIVEESRIGKIHLGDPVRVYIDALGPTEWLGRVTEIGPTTDPASRSSIVKIDLPQKADQIPGRQILHSGLFGKSLYSMGRLQVLTVPQKAVLQRGELQEVYVVGPENIARLRLIKTGKQYGQRVEVLSGIREGERIIVEGFEGVNEGSQVLTVEG